MCNLVRTKRSKAFQEAKNTASLSDLARPGNGTVIPDKERPPIGFMQFIYIEGYAPGKV